MSLSNASFDSLDEPSSLVSSFSKRPSSSFQPFPTTKVSDSLLLSPKDSASFDFPTSPLSSFVKKHSRPVTASQVSKHSNSHKEICYKNS